MGLSSADVGLRGRDGEIASVLRLLARARHGEGGASLVVRGEPGVGKTRLVDEIGCAASENGFRVLTTRGLEAEAELPFAGLAELLRGVLDEVVELPEGQTALLRGAFALDEPTAADRFRIYMASLAVLAGAAERRPLFVSVDDAHWLDRPSLEALLFIGRRVTHEGIVMLLATRDDGARPIDAASLPEIRLRGLDPGPARALLGEAAGRAISTRVAARLIEATEGNPLALIEMASILSEAQLAGRAPLEEPLQVGPLIEDSFLRRLRALPEPTRAALLIAAADESVSLDVVAVALAHLHINLDDLVPAETAGVISISDGRIRFRHPIERSVIYQAASAAERRKAHTALAEACRPDRDELRRTWHRAAGVILPDEDIACALEQAAAVAMKRGGPVAAARAYRRAAELSTDTERGAQRLLSAATALWDGSYAELALSSTLEALAATSDPVTRADVMALRGQAEMWLGNADGAFSLLTAEANRMSDIDIARAAELRGRAVAACFTAGRMARAVEVAEEAYRDGLLAGGAALVAAQAALAIASAFAGDIERSRTLGGPIIALAEGLTDVPETGDLMQAAATIATIGENYDDARRLARQLLETAETSERWGLVPFACNLLAEIDLRQGRWSDSFAHATRSEEQCREYGHAWSEVYVSLFAARLEAAWGSTDAVRDRCARATTFADQHGLEGFHLVVRAVLGFLELSLGNFAAAVDHLVIASTVATTIGAADPSLTRFAPDLVEALVRIERLDDARRHADALDAQARASGLSWTRCVADRCLALLAAEEDAVPLFEKAVMSAEICGQPFELARTRLCFGERLRRMKRRTEAREQLSTALDVFDRLGAEPWARRARGELEATGMSARSRSAPDVRQLTPQELHTAVLVARGATNREAAANLFLSPKTVEKHLGSVYRKLGIRSRSELTRFVVLEGLAEPSKT